MCASDVRREWHAVAAVGAVACARVTSAMAVRWQTGMDAAAWLRHIDAQEDRNGIVHGSIKVPYPPNLRQEVREALQDYYRTRRSTRTVGASDRKGRY